MKNQINRNKENITEREYKKLMSYIRGNESFREYRKMNLLRTFCILYYAGLRLNEVRSITFGQIYELLENGVVHIDTSKTKSERKIYLTDAFRKELIKLFSIKQDTSASIIYNDRKTESKNANISFINGANKVIKEVLGSRYSSHSFRQGLITEMGSKGINTKERINSCG